MQNGHAGEPRFDADGDADMADALRAKSGEGSEGSGEGYRDAEREPEGEDGLPEANGGFGGGVLGLAVPRQARTSKREPRQKQVRSHATPDLQGLENFSRLVYSAEPVLHQRSGYTTQGCVCHPLCSCL